MLSEKVKFAVLIALPAIAGEAVQHAVEFHFGMYVRGDGIAPGHETSLRSLAAVVKVLGFILTVVLARRQTQRSRPVREISLSTKIATIAIPLLAHYALNYSAVGMPTWLVIPFITIDCLVIGYLASSIGFVSKDRKFLTQY